MNKLVVAELGGKCVLLLDSITSLGSEDTGQIVITGSHGGRSAGEYAIRAVLACCCFNDAGVGKERAGIVALDMLQQRGGPCVAYSHNSARIGDARDAWHNGVISYVNAPAAALGFAVGESLQAAIVRAFAPRAPETIGATGALQ